MRTRAAVVRSQGAPPSIEEVEYGGLRDDEVAIRLAATGVCHTDVAIADGDIPAEFPVVLGHESAGVIEEVGRNVERVAVGDHVVLSLAHHCGHCAHCERGSPMLCSQRTASPPRMRLDGTVVAQGFGTAGFAETTVVRDVSAIRIPKDVPLEIAALMGCALAPGFGAATTLAGVHAGATVAVIGCGGIGLSVILGCTVAGAERIVAVDPDAARRLLATELGATDAGTTSEGLVDSMGGGDGFDFVFEATGRTNVMADAVAATRRGGTTTLMGVPGPRELLSIPALEFVASQRRLLGCLTGNLRPNIDFDAYCRLYLRGRLDLDRLISARVPLDATAEAFDRSRRGDGIRTLVTMG